MKKCQIHAQILIYIFTLVLVAIILVYGYRSIVSFKGRAEEVSFLKFRNDLTNQLDIIAAEYGSTKTRSFNLPAGIKKICFVDTYDASINNIPDDLDPVLADDIRADDIRVFMGNDKRALVMKSIFLLDKSVMKSFIVPTRIDIKDAGNGDTLDILCIPDEGGSVKLKFEGMGNGVMVSEAAP